MRIRLASTLSIIATVTACAQAIGPGHSGSGNDGTDPGPSASASPGPQPNGPTPVVYAKDKYAPSAIGRPTVFDDPDGAIVRYGGNLVGKVIPVGSVAPKLSAADAVEAAAKSFPPAPDLMPGKPRSYLRMASTDFGSTASAADMTTLWSGPRLSWILLWDKSGAVVRGPRMSPEQRASLMAARCIFVIAVDANTGEVFNIHQTCKGA